MKFIYASTFRIPFLEDENPQEKLKSMPVRERLFYLGIFHKESHGQVSYTPLGSTIKQKLVHDLRRIAHNYNIYEWWPPLLLSRDFFERSKRYEVFHQDIFHVHENSKILLHPTAEEWFLQKIHNYEIRIHPKKGWVGVYNVVPVFRNTTAQRKPLRLTMFNIFVGYLLAKPNKEHIIQKLSESVLQEIWKKFGIYDKVLRASKTVEHYVDYFIPTVDGDDVYDQRRGEIITTVDGHPITNSERLRGTSIGMYFGSKDLVRAFFSEKRSELRNHILYTFGVGLERLLYALYHTGALQRYKTIDYVVIPLFKIKSEADIENLEARLTKKFPEAKTFLIIDKLRGKMHDKHEYARQIGAKGVIHYGRHELSVRKL